MRYQTNSSYQYQQGNNNRGFILPFAIGGVLGYGIGSTNRPNYYQQPMPYPAPMPYPPQPIIYYPQPPVPYYYRRNR